MKLWTIQPIEIMQILDKTGVFRCNERMSEFYKDFHDAYLWMVNEMDRRMIAHPKDLLLPLWAWHTRNWEHKKPDLRNAGLGVPGEEYVCIEFEIDDDEVLLSDYNAWHYVLNHVWYDPSKNEEEFDKNQEWFTTLPLEMKTNLMQDSWQRIFNVNPNKDDWNKPGEYVQATFWELKKDMITNTKYFKAR